MGCHNWLSLPGRKRDLAAPAARGLGQSPPSSGTGCVCLCLASLGTAGSLIASFVKLT